MTTTDTTTPIWKREDYCLTRAQSSRALHIVAAERRASIRAQVPGIGRLWDSITDEERERIRQAIAMHNDGHSYGQIAKALGYESRMGPYWAVNHSTVAREMRVNGHHIAQEARNSEKTHPPTPDGGSARTGRSEREAA